MSIFEKLNSVECEAIETYIEYYGGYDGEGVSLRAPLNRILRFWEDNKLNLCRVLGDQLIVSKEVSFIKPLDLIEDDIRETVTGWQCPGRVFYDSFRDWASNKGPSDYRYELYTLVDACYLSTNIYNGESFSVITPDNRKIAINNGCKVSKVLGKIAAAFGLKGYEEFRIAHSLCLNQKSLKGELCLSIHPLDYMTMSDNECDWDSCMSWRNCGDYRMGTVEMMNSPYIVVAYLRASEDMHFGGYTWNSKKWRQLFLVTPEVITGIRQYPYNSDELSGIALQWIRSLAEKNAAWGPYSNTTVELSNYHDNVCANIDKTVFIGFSTNVMYNDFGSRHLAYIAPTIPTRYELCFSGETECMVCGYEIYHADDSSMLTCNSCDGSFRCGECGERISENDGVYVNGYRVCSYCYENYYADCALCEETEHESNMKTIRLKDGDEVTSYSIRVCDSCSGNEKFTKLFGPLETHHWSTWNFDWVVLIENCTEEGLNYFDIWRDEEYEKLKAKIKPKAKEEN